MVPPAAAAAASAAAFLRAAAMAARCSFSARSFSSLARRRSMARRCTPQRSVRSAAVGTDETGHTHTYLPLSSPLLCFEASDATRLLAQHALVLPLHLRLSSRHCGQEGRRRTRASGRALHTQIDITTACRHPRTNALAATHSGSVPGLAPAAPQTGCAAVASTAAAVSAHAQACESRRECHDSHARTTDVEHIVSHTSKHTTPSREAETATTAAAEAATARLTWPCRCERTSTSRRWTRTSSIARTRARLVVTAATPWHCLAQT